MSEEPVFDQTSQEFDPNAFADLKMHRPDRAITGTMQVQYQQLMPGYEYTMNVGDYAAIRVPNGRVMLFCDSGGSVHMVRLDNNEIK